MGGPMKVRKDHLKTRALEIVEKGGEPITIKSLAERVKRRPEQLYRVAEALARDGRVRLEKVGGIYRVAPAPPPPVPRDPDRLETEDLRILRQRIEELRALGVQSVNMRNGEAEIEVRRTVKIKL